MTGPWVLDHCPPLAIVDRLRRGWSWFALGAAGSFVVRRRLSPPFPSPDGLAAWLAQEAEADRVALRRLAVPKDPSDDGRQPGGRPPSTL